MKKLQSLLLLAAGLLAMAGAPGATKPADKIVLGSNPLMMPGSGGGMPLEMDTTSPSAAEQPAAKENEWVMAPVPFVNPLLGTGLAAGVAYIYYPNKADKTSPPWTTGIGGFVSDNKSWAVAAGHRMNLRHDTWRMSGLAGYGEVNYDFYGIGSSAADDGRLVSLSQTVFGGMAEGLFRVAEHFYAGLNYSLARVDTRYSGNTFPPWLNDILVRGQLSALMSSPALRAQWDSRDSTFLPSRGSLVDVELLFSDEAFGSDFNYQAYTLTARHYWHWSDRSTVAVYGFGRFAFGDVPFFALSMIGSKGNLRGYPVGRYQDRMAMTGQVEYRWQAWRRLGLVAFAGVGAVAPDLEGFSDATVLPSVGGGLRYLLTEDNKVNLRLDVARGRDEHLIYLSVGEAF